MKNDVRTYIWGLPTRAFHWLLVISLTGAYIAEEANLTVHVAFGYMAGILIIFRLIWGLTGPVYARFADFPIGIKSITGYLTGIRRNGNKYAGHNPLASLVMLAIMVNVLLVIFTGMMTLGQEGGQGLFKTAATQSGIEFKEVHEFWVQVLIALVVAHLAGLIADTVLHPGTGTWLSMFSGYKKRMEARNSSMNMFQKIFSFVWIIAPLVAFFLTINGPAVTLNADNQSREAADSGEEEMEHEGEND